MARKILVCVTILCAGLVACSGSPKRATQASQSAPISSRHTDVVACLDMLDQGDRWGAIAVCIGKLHKTLECREAWASVANSQSLLGSVVVLANACAASSCSELTQPKPLFCREKATNDSPKLLIDFAELEAAIVSREAGLRDHAGVVGRFAASLIALMTMEAATSVDLKVEPPNGASNEIELNGTLVISILSDGTVEFDGKHISDSDLRKRFVSAYSTDPEIEVVVKATNETLLQRIVSVMEMARESGISRLAIANGDDGG